MKTFDSLDDTFGVGENKGRDAMVPKKSPKPVRLSKEEKALCKLGENREGDFAYQRGKLFELAEKLTEITDGAMESAYETNHARSYEVAALAAKTAAEVVEKSGDVHKKMNDLEKQESSGMKAVQQGGTQQNIFLTGSTADLMRSLKDANLFDKDQE